MAIKVVQLLCPESKKSIKFPYPMEPEFFVVHNTANDASARNENAYMCRNDYEVSFHYAIDDKEVVQCLPTNVNGWHAGDGGNGKGNRKGIAIEICYSKSGGEKFIAAEKLAAAFIAQELKKRKWGIEKVTKHQDYDKKYCPHRTLDMGWQRFLDMIEEEMVEKKQPAVKPSTDTTLTAGTKLKLKKVSLYASSTTSKVSGTKTGTFYVWSNEVINNRIRITNSKNNVGKTGKVTGFINVSDAKKSVVTDAKTTSTTVKPAAKNKKVEAWQKAAIADGFKFPKSGADGAWGSECESVAKKAICKKRLVYKNRNLTKFLQEQLGIDATGRFGDKTKAAVIKYQKKNGLKASGAVGPETWKKILGV